MPIRIPEQTEKDDPTGVLLPHYVAPNSLDRDGEASVNRLLMYSYVAGFVLFLLFVMFMSW